MEKSPSEGEGKPPTAMTESSTAKTDTPPQYPPNHKRILIMLALYLAIFLVTLDQNILATAIPRITDEFHSLNDVGWYGTAYLLTMCSFQLMMGKVYKYYPAKPVFLAGIFLFEVGSAICGAAPNSDAFIVGRAIAGLGSSGMFSGLMVIMFNIVPLQQRPVYQGFFGAVFAVASVIGPVVGGTFTDKVTWRWCFYINLPIGGVSMIVTFFILHLPNQKLDPTADGWLAKIQQLDPIGNLVFFPGIVCLVLALQWGGTKYAWDNARIIVLLVLCGVFCLIFVGIQVWKGEEATLPPRIMKQRSIAATVWFGFFNGGSMMVVMYYLPIWFQAIKNVSAIDSGISLLPMILATVVGSLSSGFIISKIGYYTPFFLLSSILAAIGGGLLSMLTPETGHSKWIGFQVIFGLGLGFGSQQALNVVQTVLDRSDIATGSALVMFTRFLGSAIFLPVAQTIFLGTLVDKTSNIPGIDPNSVVTAGATELKNLVPADDLKTLLVDYNDSIMPVFYLVAGMSSATMLGSVFVEWKSLKARANKDAGVHSSSTKAHSSPAKVHCFSTSVSLPSTNVPPASLRRDDVAREMPQLLPLYDEFPHIIYTKSDPVYETISPAFNLTISTQPLVVIRPLNESHVQATVKIVRTTGIPLGIRAGGSEMSARNYKGVEKGVIIDMRSMCSVTVSEDRASAMIGGGTIGGDLAVALSKQGLFTPIGWHPRLGYAGWSLAGGYGLYSSSYGLGVDHILGARLVLADGSVVDVDKHNHPDLFWALRGAGNGIWGVVTQLTIKIYPAPTLLIGTLKIQKENWPAVLDRWTHEIEPTLPQEIAGELYFRNPTLNKPEMIIFFAWCAKQGDDLKKGWEYFDMMKSLPGAVVQRISECLTSRVAKVITRNWTNANMYMGIPCHFIHGMATRPDPSACFPLRFRHRVFAISSRHAELLPRTEEKDALVAETCARVVEELKATGDVYVGAAYENLIPPIDTDLEATFGRETLEKLRVLKKKYDPDNFFSRGYPVL
ncbi:major facilitator superfamily domain-containing protein [Trichoderma novae-zelandiae]